MSALFIAVVPPVSQALCQARPVVAARPAVGGGQIFSD